MADESDTGDRALSARQQRRHHPAAGGAARRPEARRHGLRGQPARRQWPPCGRSCQERRSRRLYVAARQRHPVSISPVLYPKLPFDAERDFKPVAPLARIDLVMVANKSLKAHSIQELVALAKGEPGKLTYASTGIGSSHQLYMELFKIRNGIDILHVPYKGTGQATPDLVSGQVDMMFFGSAQAISGVEGGQIKALGAGSLKRLERLPQVATIAESGNPDFAANNLWGIWAPARHAGHRISKNCAGSSPRESGRSRDPQILPRFGAHHARWRRRRDDEGDPRAAGQVARGHQGGEHQADGVNAPGIT